MNKKPEVIFYERLYLYHPGMRMILGSLWTVGLPLFGLPLIVLTAFSATWLKFLIFDTIMFSLLGYPSLIFWSLRQIAEVSDTGVRVRTGIIPPRGDDTWTPSQIRACAVIEVEEDRFLGTWRISGYHRPKHEQNNPGVILVFSEGGYQTFRSKRPQDFKEAVDSMKSEWLRAQ